MAAVPDCRTDGGTVATAVRGDLARLSIWPPFYELPFLSPILRTRGAPLIRILSIQTSCGGGQKSLFGDQKNDASKFVPRGAKTAFPVPRKAVFSSKILDKLRKLRRGILLHKFCVSYYITFINTIFTPFGTNFEISHFLLSLAWRNVPTKFTKFDRRRDQKIQARDRGCSTMCKPGKLENSEAP